MPHACFAAPEVTAGCLSVSVGLYVSVSFCCTASVFRESVSVNQSTNSDIHSAKFALLLISLRQKKTHKCQESGG